MRRSGVAGASAALHFTGREVAWVASLSPGSGDARVLIDGRAVAIVHLHASRPVQRRVVFTRSWATAGAHTIKIVALGTRAHPQVTLDALLTLR